MKQRIISAILMIIICIPFLILGGMYFQIFASCLAGMCLYELLKYKKDVPFCMKILSYLLLELFIFAENILKNSLDISIIIIILTYLLALIIINDSNKYNYNNAFLLIGIIIFLGVAFKSIIAIRLENLNQILYLLCIAIVTDTFALIIGKSIGKRKLAPFISPNKTIEGFMGGSIMGTIVATLFYVVAIHDSKNILIVLSLTLILSLIGQFGDLIKSSIKRSIGIKDFSNLIPGHGGILDRLDSLIFISMTYILINKLF